MAVRFVNHGDFTSQLLYASIKTGLTVPLADLAMNTLFDLLHYSAEIDEQVLNGSKTSRTAPLSIEQMLKAGKSRG